jgi:hypothetical protein
MITVEWIESGVLGTFYVPEQAPKNLVWKAQKGLFASLKGQKVFIFDLRDGKALIQDYPQVWVATRELQAWDGYPVIARYGWYEKITKGFKEV